MTRILHLSDLHFGRVSGDLVEPLVRAIDEIAPDLVAISGDLTQRARVSQFREAAAFIERLSPPVVCVPGNHDTPLDNLFLRFLFPWRRYRRHISSELEPVVANAGFALVGVNTVNPFAWQSGRIGAGHIARMRRGFQSAPAGVTRIVLMHHPLEHPPDLPKRGMRGARRAMAAFADSGAELALCGHLHAARAAPHEAAPGLLLVQSGTSLSSRTRDEENSFNLVTIDRPGCVTVEQFALTPENGVHSVQKTPFRRSECNWVQST